MNVTIQEQAVSLSANYEISAPNQELRAHKAMFSLTARIGLTRADGTEVATLDGQLSPVRHRWEFHFTDGRTYAYHCEKVWKGTYVCSGSGGESYRLYQHHGLRFSIFRDESQIAAFTKNRLVVGDGNRYDIRMNGDADVALLTSMILALNTSDGDDNNRSSVTVNFGNIGPEDRKFDESWEPS